MSELDTSSLFAEDKLPVRTHMLELRRRLVISVIAIVIGVGISFYFAPFIFDILKSRAGDISLIYVEMTEMIGTYFRVAFTAGLILASPVILYELVMFLRPGLKPNEKRYLYLLLPGILISFAGGVCFAYFIMIPPLVKFLLTFGSEIARPEIRVGDYVSLITKMVVAIGLCFEMPVVVYFLAKIGIVNAGMLSRFRKFAIVIAFIVAAIITPTPDPINQSIVAIPIILLYEIGIILARIAQHGKDKQTEDIS